MPFSLLQITAQYSNAVLVAVMPYVNDFSHRLSLRTNSVTTNDVAEFKCSNRSDLFGGRVLLKDGEEFVFLHGRIESFRTSQSFFRLQEPGRVPEFFGTVKIAQTEALTIAHRAITNLGYTDIELSADKPPVVTPPVKVRDKIVPRYRIRWADITRGHDPIDPPPSIEFEVNATTGAFELVSIKNPNTWTTDPKIGITSQVVSNGPTNQYEHGRPVVPVSADFTNAFIAAILPQCTLFAKLLNADFKNSITTNDIQPGSIICGPVDNDPMASFRLKSGAHFDYRHGQVIAFHSAKAMEDLNREKPPTREAYEKLQSTFFGTEQITRAQTVALVRQTLNRLGYSITALRIDGDPTISEPGFWGTNKIARRFVLWKEANNERTRVSAEVNTEQKRIESLFINDHLTTNIWRVSPKISIDKK